MKNLEEKIESLEQVIEALIGRLRNLEIVVGSLAENEPKDYGSLLRAIVELIKRSDSTEKIKAIGRSVSLLQEIVQRKDRKSEVRHHHHLDIRSKSRLWWILGIFVILSTSIGVATSTLIRNHQLHSDYEKYKLIRAFNPEFAKKVSDAYRNNAKKLVSVADSLLDRPISVKKKK